MASNRSRLNRSFKPALSRKQKIIPQIGVNIGRDRHPASGGDVTPDGALLASSGVGVEFGYLVTDTGAPIIIG